MTEKRTEIFDMMAELILCLAREKRRPEEFQDMLHRYEEHGPVKVGMQVHGALMKAGVDLSMFPEMDNEEFFVSLAQSIRKRLMS